MSGWSAGPEMNLEHDKAVALRLPGGTVLIEDAGGTEQLTGGLLGTWDLLANTQPSISNGIMMGVAMPVAGDGDLLFAPTFDGATVKSNRLQVSDLTWFAQATVPSSQYATVGALIEFASGKVLFAPISNTSSPIKGTRLYTPGTDSWASGADFNETRRYCTLVKLADDTVLAIGGDNNLTVERSNVAATSWAYVSPMNYARRSAQALLLSDGRVLVAGGADGSGDPVLVAEIYDPATDTWSLAGVLTDGRASDHSMIELADGAVLCVGGYVNTSDAFPDSVNTAEIYDPNANEWHAVGNMAAHRAHACLAVMSDSPLQVLVMGGGSRVSGTFHALATTEIWGGPTGVGVGTFGGSVSGNPPVVGVSFELD